MKKIVIDPGHGGYDPGAVGPSGMQEKVVALAVAVKLADILAAAGADVKLTRDSDNVPWDPDSDLAERVRISNEFGADAFVSVHANAATNPQAKGMEVWTTRGQTAADLIAESIANALQSAFQLLIFRSDMSDGDQDKEANYYVLRYTDAPAVLVELAFITNPTEEDLLKTPNFQEKAARAIAEGLAGYLGIILPEVASDRIAEAIKTLQEAGIIVSPDYWLENARPGKQVNGQYVGILLQNMAQKIAS